jgi:hypothetical protein
MNSISRSQTTSISPISPFSSRAKPLTTTISLQSFLDQEPETCVILPERIVSKNRINHPELKDWKCCYRKSNKIRTSCDNNPKCENLKIKYQNACRKKMTEDVYHQMCNRNMTATERNQIIENYDKCVLARLKHHSKCCPKIDQQHCAVFQRFNDLSKKCESQNTFSSIADISPPPINDDYEGNQEDHHQQIHSPQYFQHTSTRIPPGFEFKFEEKEKEKEKSKEQDIKQQLYSQSNQHTPLNLLPPPLPIPTFEELVQAQIQLLMLQQPLPLFFPPLPLFLPNPHLPIPVPAHVPAFTPAPVSPFDYNYSRIHQGLTQSPNPVPTPIRIGNTDFQYIPK